MRRRHLVRPGDRPPLWRATRGAVKVVSSQWRSYLWVLLWLQLGTVVVAVPVVVILLRAALDAAGVAALTEASLRQLGEHPVSVALLVALAAVASVVVLIQQGIFVLLGQELLQNRAASLRVVAVELVRAGRRLLGPEVILFAAYAFVLVPLAGFGLAASLAHSVELPEFIVAELRKSPRGTALWVLSLLAAVYLNLRLLLVPAILVVTSATPLQAFRASWRTTSGLTPRLALLVVGGAAVPTVVLGLLVVLTVVATRVSDALWPAGSPVVAGAGLTVVETAALLVTGVVVAVVSQVLLVVLRLQGDLMPAPGAAGDLVDGATESAPAARPRSLPPSVRGIGLGVVVVGLGLAGTANTAAMVAVDDASTTAVIAHRGVTEEAVENTLEALQAAAARGVDYVEVDVKQAGDGTLVVVHDMNLRRLAGVDVHVFDMTAGELAAIPVRQRGHVSSIPTFEEVSARAAELGMPLVVEFKLHGRERGDYLAEAVAVLRAHGQLESSRIQSFDREVVEELEARFPEVNTGWVVAYLRGRLEAGSADFVAVEQGSYTPRLLAEAHRSGTQVFVWSPADPVRLRTLVRDGVDGVITGQPVRALEERAAVAAETGLAQRLEDTLRGIVDW